MNYSNTTKLVAPTTTNNIYLLLPAKNPVEVLVEVLVEETPVEAPVEETPVEETPVEETPVVETPVVETPVVVVTPTKEQILKEKLEILSGCTFTNCSAELFANLPCYNWLFSHLVLGCKTHIEVKRNSSRFVILDGKRMFTSTGTKRISLYERKALKVARQVKKKCEPKGYNLFTVYTIVEDEYKFKNQVTLVKNAALHVGPCSITLTAKLMGEPTPPELTNVIGVVSPTNYNNASYVKITTTESSMDQEDGLWYDVEPYTEHLWRFPKTDRWIVFSEKKIKRLIADLDIPEAGKGWKVVR